MKQMPLLEQNQRRVHGALGSTSALHAGGTGIETLCIQLSFFLLFFLPLSRTNSFANDTIVF
jgi:hypothetical protein